MLLASLQNNFKCSCCTENKCLYPIENKTIQTEMIIGKIPAAEVTQFRRTFVVNRYPFFIWIKYEKLIQNCTFLILS